jgi:hypothetical protein
MRTVPALDTGAAPEILDLAGVTKDLAGRFASTPMVVRLLSSQIRKLPPSGVSQAAARGAPIKLHKSRLSNRWSRPRRLTRPAPARPRLLQRGTSVAAVTRVPRAARGGLAASVMRRTATRLGAWRRRDPGPAVTSPRSIDVLATGAMRMWTRGTLGPGRAPWRFGIPRRSRQSSAATAQAEARLEAGRAKLVTGLLEGGRQGREC